jgi:hypothetical protein
MVYRDRGVACRHGVGGIRFRLRSALSGLAVCEWKSDAKVSALVSKLSARRELEEAQKEIAEFLGRSTDVSHVHSWLKYLGRSSCCAH